MRRLALLSILGTALFLPVAAYPQHVITTRAGQGVTRPGGDGGPATAAALAFPESVAVDSNGNVFVADSANSRIRRIDPVGMIGRVAGNGTRGNCGDGQAVATCLSNPAGVAVDAAGNLFIAEATGHRVRKVDVTGFMSTIAGTGVADYCGDAHAAKSACLNNPVGLAVDAAGSLFIADTFNNRIRKIDLAGTITTVAGNGTAGFCGDDGPATLACLFNPSGVAFDTHGNLLIADTWNNRIRRVDLTGKIVTVAGSGASGLCGDSGQARNACLFGPRGVTADADGNLYIADSFNDRVRRVDALGVISTMAGTTPSATLCKGRGVTGPANAACVLHPSGVALDAAGALLVSETGGHRLRKVEAGAALTTRKVVLPGGCEIVRLSIDLALPPPAGGVQWRLSDSSDHVGVGGPTGVSTFPAGRTHVTPSLQTRAVTTPELVDIMVTFTPSPAVPWIAPGLVRSVKVMLRPIAPLQVVLGPSPVVGGQPAAGIAILECAAAPNDVVVELSAGSFAALDTPSITIPAGQDFGRFGLTTLPVTRTRTTSIGATTSGGTASKGLVITPAIPPPAVPWVKTVAGGGPFPYCCRTEFFGGDGGPATAATLSPTGVGVDGAGNVLIADGGSNTIRRVDPTGRITRIAGNGLFPGYCGDGGPAISACLYNPTDVAADSEGNTFISDGARIRLIDGAGTISTLVGPLDFDRLTSIVVDGHGNVFVAAPSANRVLKYTPGVGVTIVAGTGARDYCGDGGPAAAACLAFPTGLALDGAGNLFIADQGNSRVRRVDTDGTITTVVGIGPCSGTSGGGQATSACVVSPHSVAVDAAGRLFVIVSAGGEPSNTILAVDQTGTISRLAGGGNGFCGDGGPAASACFSEMSDLAVDGKGHLLVVDSGRVRQIQLDPVP